MLPVILQITAGISISLFLTKDVAKSIALAPLLGAIFLAVVFPLMSIDSFVAIEIILLLAGVWAIRKADKKVDKFLLLIFIAYTLVVTVNLYKEPYVASWMNQDEPFHLMRSNLYATTGSLPLDYPPLVHMIGGTCYKLGGEWYLWYRAVLALLIPSEGALIYMIAREFDLNPVIASIFYLLMCPSLIHLFEIGTYSNLVLDPLILLDAYLLIRDKMLPASVISFLLPLSNTLSWIFVAYACIIYLIRRSKKIIYLIPSFFWLVLPLSASRVQSYASKVVEDVPIGVKLAVIEGIPLDIWYFFGASFSLGVAGLLARSSWEKRRKYLSFYSLFIFIVVIIFAAGNPSLCWRFLLLLPFPLSMTATCLIERINLISMKIKRFLSPAVLVFLILAFPPVRGNTPYQDAIPFVHKVCNEYKMNMSSYGLSAFPSVFGCSVERAGALEDLLLDGSKFIITRKTQLERILVEKDPCIRIISSSSSADLIEYLPKGNQSRVEGIYLDNTTALLYLNETDVIVVTAAYGAVCKIFNEDPLIVKCPDLTIRRVIVFKKCLLPQFVELQENSGG